MAGIVLLNVYKSYGDVKIVKDFFSQAQPNGERIDSFYGP